VAEYIGLVAISKRLGIGRTTLLRWHERFGVLMYPRHRGPRRVWYSNDTLIAAWEMARCRVAHVEKYARVKGTDGRVLRHRPKDTNGAGMAPGAHEHRAPARDLEAAPAPSAPPVDAPR